MRSGPAPYPGVSEAHLEIARRYSNPLLFGPPMCEDLVKLVQHMYTEEEAEVVRHLKIGRRMTAGELAAACGRPLEEVSPVLGRLAHEKFVLFSHGAGEDEFFVIMPVVPGTFELVMIQASTEQVTPWHRRFAELFETLFSTGFLTDYIGQPEKAGVRYVPVGQVIEALPSALPSDRLEAHLEKYDDFSIGVCQCRLTKEITGDGCGRMLETCAFYGDMSRVLVREGKARQASRRDVLEVKRAAEREGLVTWILNLDRDSRFDGSCSCCGCCCGALRSISEFNTPGFMSPPHFVPEILAACNACGRCCKACPMGALVLAGEGGERRLVYKRERCIGCGLCAVACENESIRLVEAPGYRTPTGNALSLLRRGLPSHLVNAAKVWHGRKRH